MITDVTNEREYHLAVQRVFALMVGNPAPHTPEGEELARLAAAVERFEAERFPISCCAFAAKDCAERLLILLRSLADLYDLPGAIGWFESHQPALDGQRPIDMVISERGASDVEAVIARLHEGVHI